MDVPYNSSIYLKSFALVVNASYSSHILPFWKTESVSLDHPFAVYFTPDRGELSVLVFGLSTLRVDWIVFYLHSVYTSLSRSANNGVLFRYFVRPFFLCCSIRTGVFWSVFH